jgi:hypothetical protein
MQTHELHENHEGDHVFPSYALPRERAVVVHLSGRCGVDREQATIIDTSYDTQSYIIFNIIRIMRIVTSERGGG